MNGYAPQPTFIDRLFASTPLTAQGAAVIKQTYILFGISVFCALAGGYLGSTSETLARFFSGWIGWIVALVILNAVPRIAMAVRHNPVLGVTALVGDGFLSGIALSPILFYARTVAPDLILGALGITGFVFIGITLYIMTTRKEFAAPRGLMTGLFFSLIGAMVLNSFLNIGFLGILISFGIGAIGVLTIVSSTSMVLRSPDADSPIPGSLMLFAGVFNVFVATLNILLRLFSGSRD